MNLAKHISHYFEKEYGPWRSICDLDPQQRGEIIHREKEADTGFNRYAYGEEFFDFRQLADDLLMELYERKFGKTPARRPYYAVLGDADVIGGLYRDPHKVRVPMEDLSPHEVTFMCPDHFHLVTLMDRSEGRRVFGYQIPEDYSESKYPYFGKLLSYEELVESYQALRIDQYLETNFRTHHWHRYVEAQVWADPVSLRERFPLFSEVTPESYTLNGVTYANRHWTRQREASESDDPKPPSPP